ncbi:hypothetical protein CBS101457_006781 [Exobasidium rhododendri]|nr:hypothetical protein CBS101457_006781 [Exobasidium rhododendri]
MTKRPRTADSVESTLSTKNGKWTLNRLSRLSTFGSAHSLHSKSNSSPISKSSASPLSSPPRKSRCHYDYDGQSNSSNTLMSSSDHTCSSTSSRHHQSNHEQSFPASSADTTTPHRAHQVASSRSRARGLVKGFHSFVADRLDRSKSSSSIYAADESPPQSSFAALYPKNNSKGIISSPQYRQEPSYAKIETHSPDSTRAWRDILVVEDDEFPMRMTSTEMEGLGNESLSRPGSIVMSEAGSDSFASVQMHLSEISVARNDEDEDLAGRGVSSTCLSTNTHRIPAKLPHVIGGFCSPPLSPLSMIRPLSPHPSHAVRLEDFDVLQTLGTGTFGRVLLVRKKGADINNRCNYFALKVLNKSQIVRLKQVEHSNSEQSVLKKVDHPFIVTLHATFQDSLNCYMLMEYVVGGEIFSHLRRAKRFSVDVTRFYVACLVLAIAHLHSKRIIYRDLKPENLLIDDQGYVKITDFGFSKELDHTDRTWTLCGTPEYLSPEVIQSRGQSFASDYWALGILIFEMLCGHPPFFDSTPFGTYEKILKADINFPAHVDEDSRSLIRSLLTVDVSKRLGNLRGGARDVMNHPWFRGVAWDQLLQKKLGAPIIPSQRHASDSSNFDTYDHFHISNMPGIAIGMQADQESVKSDPWRHLFTAF